MNELIQELNKFTVNDPKSMSPSDMAKKWAEFCLETYKGKLLKKGLQISIALVEFSEEYK